ncbi:NAD(P)/FAD-dependent oxidoreductase [Saccharopolyspora pogona]|uniref:NAD(P)/FAD-dependent oxidoreductase n=1 Tax=Saccharopolyspora pogona TaxID=333966 RepID=UPI001683E1E3|nr:FAD-binding oxidoreductase [Saccharopolyspora pogona]
MPTTKGRRPDVVIVGGGIIGLATAYELGREGIAVALLDADVLGSGQSTRGWGFVRQQGRSPQELSMMRAANRRWSGLEDELDEKIEWVQGGNLALAGADAAEKYVTWAGIGAEHGLDTRLVDPFEVQELVPGLRLPHDTAIYTSSDGHADPVSATRAYGEAAARAGAVVLTGWRALALERRGDRVIGVHTDHGPLRAETVVCAAGAGSRRLLRTAGIRLPQNRVRGTVGLTAPVPPVSTTSVWASGLAFRQRPDGRMIFSTGGGGDVDLTLDTLLQAPHFMTAFLHNHRRMRLRVNAEALRELRHRFTGVEVSTEPCTSPALARRSLTRLRAALPSQLELRAERFWAGVIDATPDGLPVLDRLAEHPGLVVATGFSGHGFGLAPAVGEVVAALVNNARPDHDVHPFRLRRFADGDYRAPTAIL